MWSIDQAAERFRSFHKCQHISMKSVDVPSRATHRLSHYKILPPIYFQMGRLARARFGMTLSGLMQPDTIRLDDIFVSGLCWVLCRTSGPGMTL
jgi:hypothetical protein